MNKIKKQSGFTIIEVMIVLAIAGLIMVVVFIAVPQLQARQRDEARKDVLRRVTTEINNYASNNNGKYPFSTDTEWKDEFQKRYITGNVPTDVPGGNGAYFLSIRNSVKDLPGPGGMYFYPGVACDGEKPNQGGSGATDRKSRIFSATVKLEGKSYSCIDNK